MDIILTGTFQFSIAFRASDNGFSDLIVISTGRAVPATEAKHLNLANYIVPQSQNALEFTVNLANQIAAHPQICMRNDRLSAIESVGRTEEDAMRREFELGMRSLKSNEQLGAIGSFFGEKKKGEVWTSKI